MEKRQSPLFQASLIQCDYNRGWTWHLRLGTKDFLGWMPNGGSKPFPTPEEAYADFVKWLDHVGMQEMQQTIKEQKDVLQSPTV